MHTLRKTNVWKALLAMLLVALLFLVAISTAAASGGGLASAAADPGPDPGIDPGVARPYVFVPEIRFAVTDDAVQGAVRVLDQSNRPVAGALVTARWTFPNGKTLKLLAETHEDGYADFLVEKFAGKNQLDVLDVQFGSIPFLAGNSQLTGTIIVDK